MNKLYNRFLRRCVPLFLLITLFAGAVSAQQEAPIQKGVLHIKIKEAYVQKLEQSANGRSAAVNVKSTGLKQLNAVNASYKATSMTRVFPDAGKYEAKHRKHGLHLWYEVQIDSTASEERARAAYLAIPEIEIAEPVHKKAILDYDEKTLKAFLPSATPAAPGPLPTAMNDPRLDQQWHYNNHGQTFGKAGTDIDLFKAWSIETGKRDVIVAIVDGGIEATHPDLKDNMWINEKEIPGNGKDDDNNGYVDDIHGYSFVDMRATIKPHPHGTHVAGTVSAVNNNGIGVSGVAGGSGNGDGVRLMSCSVFKFLTAQTAIGGGFANAYVYAADNGAVISQNSWGYNQFGAYDQVVLDAIDYFIAEAGQDENGVQTGPMKGGIVIFSVGNDGASGMKYPAYYDQTLAVSALTHRNTKSYYSNYGDWIDIAAPGGELGFNPDEEGILSTAVGGQYAYNAGTSMAAPHVSGAAALIVSHFGGAGFTPAEVRQRLLGTTDDINNDNPDYAGMLGVGRLNAFNALQGENDLTGPEAIKNLQVKSVSDTAISLQWTAPGDKGSNSASFYEIRYATSPITAANFAEAAYVPGQPRPAPAGTAEAFTIPGLELGVNYYVAMVAYDMFRNVSPLSNLVQATTQQPVKGPAPIIAINPFPLQVEMMPTDSVVRKVFITNRGTANLTYTIERNGDFGVFEERFKVLTFSKRSGTVAPGKSDTLLLTFEPFEIPYSLSEEFIVTSNDPVNGSIAWPIQAMVNETHGKPVFTSAQLDLGKAMVGTNSGKTISLKSTGSKNIQLLGYTFDNPDFYAFIGDFYPMSNFSTVPLSNYGVMDFKVFFRPSKTGKATGTLTIRTDDPAYPVLTLPLSGGGLPAPAAAVDAAPLSASLKTGESVTRQMMLRNTGASEMTFNVLEKGLHVEPKKALVVCPDGAGVAIPFLLSPYKEITVDVADRLKDLTVADLLPYQVVIVLNQRTWESGAGVKPEKLGDLLADYIDAGGKVIVNQFAYYGFEYFDEKTGLEGRFITENYGPFISDVTPYIPPQALGEVLIPGHPLLEGVNKLTYNGALQRVKLNPGATGIARWGSGEWVLAANSNVVGMNFMPLGQNAATQTMTGDIQQLYRNAIHWLTGSANLSVQPSSGNIAPGGSVALEVQINANKLATGLYHSALGIASNDPYHGQIIVPVAIQVEGPAFAIEPGAISLNAAVDQQTSQQAALRNEGTLAFPYSLSIQHIQSLSPIVADSVSTKYYSTGFSGLEVARFTGVQTWSDSGKWYVDTIAAYSGRQHLRYTSNGMRNRAEVISPRIETGSGKSFCSARIMLQGEGTSFGIAALSLPSYFPATTITFGGDGTARVDVYNAQTESFGVGQIKGPIPPRGEYFTVSIELDKATSVFNVYFDQKLVFTGSAPLQSINAIAFNCDNSQAGQQLYVDNVIVRQGGAEPALDFLQVSPLSGTLQPEAAATLTVQANAQGLKAGVYSADVLAVIGEGIGQSSLPVTLKVTGGGASVMKVSHDNINARADYKARVARFFEISNFGGQPFDFTVGVPEEAASWLSVEPASGKVEPNSISVVKVIYSAGELTPGSYASTISIGSDASNKQSHVITTALEVGEPAMLVFGPPSIQIEMIGGNEMDFPLFFTNTGNSVLHMTFEQTGKEWLKVEPGTRSLGPVGGQLIFPVTLSAVNVPAGVYNDLLHIQTSDPARPSVDVPVQLTVIAPSALNVSTDTLRAVVEAGAQVSKDIDIANTGAAELKYVIGSNSIDEATPFHGGPDAFGYTFIKTGATGGPAFVWNDISATGVPVTLGDFDSLTVTLPFAFPFYGVAQQEVKICSDGFLTFGSIGLPARGAENRNLFNTAAPNNLIAGHWDDLDPRLAGTIHYKKETDKFTVQFTSIAINSWGYPTEAALQNTFQIVLHADGSIAFHYLDIMASPQQLVGIENADATDALLVKDVWDWVSSDSVSFLVMPTVPWMNIAGQSDALTGGGQSQVNVQFDATGLEEGIYPATLYITSNDRKNPVTRIPITMDTQLTTGIVKEEAKDFLSLYPVPAKDRLNIKLTRKTTRNVGLAIRNAMGQTIFEQEVDERKISGYALDLAPLHLAPGVYSLQLVSQDGWITAKSFVKQ